MSEAICNNYNDSYSESFKSSQKSTYDNSNTLIDSDVNDNIKLFSTISITDNLSTGISVMNASFCTKSIPRVYESCEQQIANYRYNNHWNYLES